MARGVRGGFGQKIRAALHSEGVEVPTRVVVLLYRERGPGGWPPPRVRTVFSQPTLGRVGRCVRMLSHTAARLALYRQRHTRAGEPCRIQVQAWMADGRRLVVIDDHSTRGIIEWKAGELWAVSSATGT
jgi:hypothetical protein